MAGPIDGGGLRVHAPASALFCHPETPGARRPADVAQLYRRTGPSDRPRAGTGLGARGRILEIPGSPRHVAKLYHPGSKGVEPGKLAALLAAQDKDLLEVAAWPVTTLHRGSPSRPRAGLRHAENSIDEKSCTRSTASISAQTLSRRRLGNARHRRDQLRRHLNRVHQRGIVVGDVNQKNLLVAADGSVRIVDCDSFQVRTPKGRVYRCGVGVPEFTPPELQGKPSFASFDRTPDHDCFGLSVMIFYLLFGRHPYAGRGASGGSLAKAIRENRFAYTRNQGTRRAMPPPARLTLESCRSPWPCCSSGLSLLPPRGSNARPPPSGTTRWRRSGRTGPLSEDRNPPLPPDRSALPVVQAEGRSRRGLLPPVTVPLTQVPTVKPGVRAAVPANQATGQSTASSWKTLLFGLSLVLFALNLAGLFRARQSVQVPEPVPASVQAAVPVQAPAPFQTPPAESPPPEGPEASSRKPAV